MPFAPRRIDLHCHSDASNKTSEAMLNAIHCPESYSSPEEVFAQARRRGMDFVTLTDHDSIEGAINIAHRPEVLVGEELTCWFPEDHCKMHILVWGLDRAHHEALQSRARDIYSVAEYIESNQLAHSVAHPIYRQNDKLERWHVERLLLLFKGFECLNGAHSSLHREAFEPLLDRLTRQEIARLSETHSLVPRWPDPWIKSRTAGSDDHGLLNVGRTWTEFPAEVQTTGQLLACLRIGACHPGGEAGSSAKLAHTFYSVAVRYYSRYIMAPGQSANFATTVLQAIAGERPAPTKRQLLWLGLKGKVRKLIRPGSSRKREFGMDRFKQIFVSSARQQLAGHPELRKALDSGLPPLGEHEQMFHLISQMNRDMTQGLAAAVNNSIDKASFTGLFDSIGALIGQQFVLLPYYFAVFHQNKERHLLRQITRMTRPKEAGTLRVGLFTDTFGEVNGVARFLQDMREQASRTNRQLVIHTCGDTELPGARNFVPLLSRPMPCYEQLRLNLPPLLEVLEWSDRQQFDAVHVSTPGPMGLCGWAVSRMLRVPMLATYHTDFPAYVDKLCGDHRITAGTVAYMKWFYGQADAVFTRSGSYRFNLRDLGVDADRTHLIPPGIDLNRFSPAHRSTALFDRLRVTQPLKLLYCGRVSIEKNLPMLAEIFRNLAARRSDVALIVGGDGPYLQEMKESLRGLPAYFAGVLDDASLAPLYAGSDLFVFPSRTDTLGQVVMEAQASGLPAVVGNEGGPKEIVEHSVTGLVLPDTDTNAWCSAIEDLLDNPARRARMASAAAARMADRSIQRSFDQFWNTHLALVEPGSASQVSSQPSPAPVPA